MATPKKKGGGGLNLGAAPPPPQKKTSGGASERASFTAFVNKHKALRPWAAAIWTWGNTYKGITPTELAAVVWSATQGSPDSASVKGLVRGNQNVNAAGVPLDATAQQRGSANYGIQWAAWAVSGATTQTQSVDQGYQMVFGGTATSSPVSSVLPKNYLPTPGPSIDQSVTGSVTKSQLTHSLKDPWLVATPKGFKYVNSINPPKDAVTWGGTPITQSQYTSVWNQSLKSTFEAYTGRQATAKEISQILAEAPDAPTLALELSKRPGFTHSPVWKRTAPGLVGVARSILGNDWQPHGGLIRDAIVQNWDQATFETHLRQLPEYTKGPEYRTNLDQNTKAFENIYGVDSTADPTVQALLRDKTKAGWSPDQLSLWAQQQPAYKSSPAYMTKMVSFLQQLGLITGNPATITQQQVDAMLNSAHNVANVTTAVDQAGGVHAGTSPANPTGTSVVPGRGTISVH